VFHCSLNKYNLTMKKFKFLILSFIISAFFISVTSCNSKSEGVDNNDEQTETNTANDEKVSGEEHSETHEHKETAMTSFQCPMKCEGDKTYTEKEKCPKCGMEMEEVKN